MENCNAIELIEKYIGKKKINDNVYVVKNKEKEEAKKLFGF